MKNQKGYSNIITNFIYGEKPVGMTLGKPFWFTARVFSRFRIFNGLSPIKTVPKFREVPGAERKIWAFFTP